MMCTVLATFGFILLVLFCIWDWILKRQPQVGERHNKCVFITGCDSGFGNGLAVRLDIQGVPVFAGCQTEAGARDLEQKASGRLRTVLLDLASSESVARAYEFVKNNLPPESELWGVVNNAGTGGIQGPLEMMSRQGFRDLYEVNLIGLMDVTQTFLPLLKSSGGRVVNVSSGGALMTLPNLHPYLTSKYAVRAFSGALRAEKAIHGMKVSCVMPSGFNTPINNLQRMRADLQAHWDTQPSHVKDEYGDDYIDECMKLRTDMMKDAPYDFTPVVDAYEHALFAKYPRDEYAPGAEMAALIISLLPPLLLQYLQKILPRKKWFSPDPKVLSHNRLRVD